MRPRMLTPLDDPAMLWPPVSYTMEVDQCSDQEWMEALTGFDDASIFQTRSYGEHFWRRSRLTSLVIRKEGQIRAMAQGRVIKIPGMRLGIVNFVCAPIWRRRAEHDNPGALHAILRSIKHLYGEQQGLLVRVRTCEPDVFHEESEVAKIFLSEGYHINPQPFYRTILIDLTPSLDELRRNLDLKWRRNLVKAEKNNLLVHWGTEAKDYEMFRALYNEMFDRKHPEKWFDPDLDKYWKIQENLPENQKMLIFICTHENEPVAATVLTTLGDTGMNIFAATGSKGLKKKLYAANMLQWVMIGWLKENGFNYYDLRGYEPEKYPGVSYFKSGLGGQEMHYAEFWFCSNRINLGMITLAERFKNELHWKRLDLQRLWENRPTLRDLAARLGHSLH